MDLPDRANERNVYVMAGIELVARRMYGQEWQVKSVGCNLCGKCCQNLSDDQPYPIEVVDGQCIHLQKEPGDNDQWVCALGLQRPFGCSVGEPETDYCSIEWVSS